MKRVLLTGAAGGIGGRLRKILKPIYPDLRLSDIKRPADLGNDETFMAAELANASRRSRSDRRMVSTASSILAAIPSKGHGRRSCSPTSSVATICSRRRAERA